MGTCSALILQWEDKPRNEWEVFKKKGAISYFSAVLLLLPDLFKKEDTFGGRVLHSQTEEYFENDANTRERSPGSSFLKASLFPCIEPTL